MIMSGERPVAGTPVRWASGVLTPDAGMLAVVAPVGAWLPWLASRMVAAGPGYGRLIAWRQG
jgi:hypothetical protein